MCLNIPMDCLPGFCFDDASNMSGHFRGVQAKLKEQTPTALYVHYSNHALDLILQEPARDVTLVADMLNFVQSLSVAMGSPQNERLSFSHVLEVTMSSVIYYLCALRDGSCAQTLKRACSAYGVILQTLTLLQKDKTLRADTRAKLSGLYKQATKAKTYFGLVSCEALFGPCKEVAKMLQHKKASAGGALECVNVLKCQMLALRENASVSELVKSPCMCSTEQLENASSNQNQQNTCSSARYTDGGGPCTMHRPSAMETRALSSSGYYHNRVRLTI